MPGMSEDQKLNDANMLRSAPMGDLRTRLAEARRLKCDKPKAGKWVAVPLAADELVHLSQQQHP